MKLKKIVEKIFPFLYSKKTYLAFGVEGSPTKYPLDKARYLRMASYIHEEYLSQKRTIKILDIGCSEGMMLLYAAHNGSKTEFHGIDILEERKQKALARGYRSVLLEDIRECRFDFPDGFFDVVICSHILEHLEDPGRLLDKLRPIVRDTGLLLVGVPVGLLPGVLWRQYVTPILNPINTREESLKRFGHVTFFTLPRLKMLLKKHGFRVDEARGDFLLRARRFFLENYKWWFDFNQLCGKIFPGVLGHVTVRAHKVPRA